MHSGIRSNDPAVCLLKTNIDSLAVWRFPISINTNNIIQSWQTESIECIYGVTVILNDIKLCIEVFKTVRKWKYDEKGKKCHKPSHKWDQFVSPTECLSTIMQLFIYFHTFTSMCVAESLFSVQADTDVPSVSRWRAAALPSPLVVSTSTAGRAVGPGGPARPSSTHWYTHIQ